VNAEKIFLILNTLPMPGWLLLVFAPRWKYTLIITSTVLLTILAVAYIILLVSGLQNQSGGGFGTLQEVQALFSNPLALVAGWAHYLAFDLFIGSWQVSDARRRGLPHGFVIPCLFFTLMSGPAGLLLYFILRSIRLKQLSPLIAHSEKA